MHNGCLFLISHQNGLTYWDFESFVFAHAAAHCCWGVQIVRTDRPHDIRIGMAWSGADDESCEHHTCIVSARHDTHESYNISLTRPHTVVGASKSCARTVPTISASAWRGPEQITSRANTRRALSVHVTNTIHMKVMTFRSRGRTLPLRRPNRAHGPPPRYPHRHGVVRSR